ncbi:Tn3 family transposase [Nonomuraea sp. SBT364]|uniref:Tn3 family transposase n=1 Tax=Nonomuraea sp. SBT364 TaxID=1580530 RepID=UPI0012E2C062
MWNSFYVDKALGALQRAGYPLAEEDVARLSPFGRRHINVIGTYTFALPDLGPGSVRELRNPDEPEWGRLTSTSTARLSKRVEAAQHDQLPSLLRSARRSRWGVRPRVAIPPARGGLSGCRGAGVRRRPPGGGGR